MGHSVEDCLHKARRGIDECVTLLKEKDLPVPKGNPKPAVVIQNEKWLEKERVHAGTLT